MALHPETPDQLCDLIARHAPEGGRLVALRPEPWRRGKRVRVDHRRGVLRAPYRKPYTDEQGALQVLVAIVRFPLDKPMPPR